MEPQHRIEGLVGNNDIFVVHIYCDTACISQDQVRSADGPPGWNVSIVKDAPHTNIIVIVVTAIASGRHDAEDHSASGIGRHQNRIFASGACDDAKRFRIARSHAIKNSNSATARDDEQIVNRIHGHTLGYSIRCRDLQEYGAAPHLHLRPWERQALASAGAQRFPRERDQWRPRWDSLSVYLGPKILRTGGTSPLASPRNVRIAKP